MIHVAIVLALLLAAVLNATTRSARASKSTKTLRYHFLNSSLECLAIFAAVGACYEVVFGLAAFADVLSTRTLHRIDTTVSWLSGYLLPLKLSATGVLVALCTLYLLGALRVPLFESPRALRAFQRYRTLTRRLYIAVVVASSITLLGTQMGPAQSALALQIKANREGYSALRRQISDELSEGVAREALLQAKAALPSQYASDLEAPRRLHESALSLGELYGRAEKEHGLVMAPTAALVARYRPLPSGSITVIARGTYTEARGNVPDPVTVACEDLSHRQIQKARVGVEAFSRTQQHEMPLLVDERAREIVLQLPRVATEQIKKTAFQEVITSHPILGPVIDVFVRTVDKAIDQRLQERIGRLTSTVGRTPEAIRTRAPAEAREIIGLVEIKFSEAHIEAIKMAHVAYTGEAQRIERERLAVQRGIELAEDRETARLMVALHERSEGVRERAADQLAQRGSSLRRKHVEELERLLREEEPSWSKKLYRESHCTWYEDTKIKFYAGQVLEKADSQLITGGLRAEARTARESGRERKRVMDPGWV